jgi:hypothetical protein
MSLNAEIWKQAQSAFADIGTAYQEMLLQHSPVSTHDYTQEIAQQWEPPAPSRPEFFTRPDISIDLEPES